MPPLGVGPLNWAKLCSELEEESDSDSALGLGVAVLRASGVQIEVVCKRIAHKFMIQVGVRSDTITIA